MALSQQGDQCVAIRGIMSSTKAACQTCGKPQVDEKAFRQVIILCHEEGWHVLESREWPYCTCSLEKAEMVVRLASIRQQRSKVKRRLVLAIKLARKHKNSGWSDIQSKSRSKTHLVKRIGAVGKGRKAVQRQLIFEDLVLWGGREAPDGDRWVLRDVKGNPHTLEEVLDSAVVKEMMKSWGKKTVARLGQFLSILARDPGLLSKLDRTEPLEEWECIDSDVEKMWAARLDGYDLDPDLQTDVSTEDELIDTDLSAYFWPDEMPGKP
jgi:hypothetical protein